MPVLFWIMIGFILFSIILGGIAGYRNQKNIRNNPRLRAEFQQARRDRVMEEQLRYAEINYLQNNASYRRGTMGEHKVTVTNLDKK
jgi:hypothetical protein